MTISTTYVPDNYAGDASTTSFAITFAFLSVSTNVKASIKVDSTGVITEKTAGSHYNVSGSNVVFTGGNVPASGETIILELNPDFKQTSDYAENDRLPAETLEADLDERTLESQVVNDSANRAIKFDASVTVSGTLGQLPDPSSNADKYLKLNSGSDGWEYQTLSSTAGLGNVVDDASPQLGGDLDLNTFDITGGGDITADSLIIATGAFTTTFSTTATANRAITVPNLSGTMITGTAGTSGNVVEWSTGGAVVDSSLATSAIMDLGTAQEHTATHNFNQTALTSSSASIAWDAAANQVVTHTATENTTIANPTNLVAGGTYIFTFVQHASSAKTLAFGSVFKWPGGTAPTISTGASAVDVLTFVSDGTNMYGAFSQDFS